MSSLQLQFGSPSFYLPETLKEDLVKAQLRCDQEILGGKQEVRREDTRKRNSNEMVISMETWSANSYCRQPYSHNVTVHLGRSRGSEWDTNRILILRTQLFFLYLFSIICAIPISSQILICFPNLFELSQPYLAIFPYNLPPLKLTCLNSCYLLRPL